MSGDQRPGIGESDAEVRHVRGGVVNSSVAARNATPLKVVQGLEDHGGFPGLAGTGDGHEPHGAVLGEEIDEAGDLRAGEDAEGVHGEKDIIVSKNAQWPIMA